VRYNPPENPNQVKGWGRAWAAIPECTLKDDAREELRRHMVARGKGFIEAFDAACPGCEAERSPERFNERSGERWGEPPSRAPVTEARGGSGNQEQEQEQEQDREQDQDHEASCAEAVADAPAPAPAPIILSLPCVGAGPKAYGVTQAQVESWREAFPGVDVVAELRKARAWLEANPSKRKTAKGAPRFLVAWLGRAQDGSGGRGGSSAAGIGKVHPDFTDSSAYTEVRLNGGHS
jgi:hypothetical protein